MSKVACRACVQRSNADNVEQHVSAALDEGVCRSHAVIVHTKVQAV